MKKNQDTTTQAGSARLILPAFAAALTLLAGSAHAAVIAEYTFDGGSAATSDTESNSTAADFLKRPSDPDSRWGFSGGAGNVFAQSIGTTNSEAAAVTANDHFSFTVTPDSGFEMNLTTITFDTLHNATAGGTAVASATMSFFLRSSIDSYASNIGSTFTQAWDTSTSRSVDLSAAAFQDITTATTFRLYIYDSGVNTTQNGARLDNVVLNGDVTAIPEPSGALLGGLGLLALLRRRR